MAWQTKINGVPWHVDRYTRAEGDERRHSSRCKYHRKSDKYCAYHKEKCWGAAHCDIYCERNIDTNRIVKPKRQLSSFHGAHSVFIEDVFSENSISFSDVEIERDIRYYMEHGCFAHPIVVVLDDNKYILKDNYSIFFAAKELGLLEVLAEMGSESELGKWKKIRTVGTRVSINDECGVVKAVSLEENRVLIKMDSGKERLFNYYDALEKRSIDIE